MGVYSNSTTHRCSESLRTIGHMKSACDRLHMFLRWNLNRRRLLFAGILSIIGSVIGMALADDASRGVSPEEVKRYFDERGKTVVTFVGYSGAGYEDVDRMIEEARNVLSIHSPKRVIVNIGATVDGVGAVYRLAKEMGFETTGIVSIQAKKSNAKISPDVGKVFFVADETWGGFKAGTQTLNPTSRALVLCSDIVVGIGGGAIARDELIAAKSAGRIVKFIPADKNHKAAIDKARKKNLPVPGEFHGAAFEVFGKGG